MTDTPLIRALRSLCRLADNYEEGRFMLPSGTILFFSEAHPVILHRAARIAGLPLGKMLSDYSPVLQSNGIIRLGRNEEEMYVHCFGPPTEAQKRELSRLYLYARSVGKRMVLQDDNESGVFVEPTDSPRLFREWLVRASDSAVVALGEYKCGSG